MSFCTGLPVCYHTIAMMLILDLFAKLAKKMKQRVLVYIHTRAHAKKTQCEKMKKKKMAVFYGRQWTTFNLYMFLKCVLNDDAIAIFIVK